MRHQQETAAGDETVGNIEYGKIHEVSLNHIHHETKAETVDHITDAAAVDGHDQPAFEIGEGPALAGKFPDNGRGKENKYHHEQPLGTLKRGEGSTGITHISQAQQTGQKVNMTMEGYVLKYKKLGKLIRGHNTRGKKT